MWRLELHTSLGVKRIILINCGRRKKNLTDITTISGELDTPKDQSDLLKWNIKERYLPFYLYILDAAARMDGDSNPEPNST